MVICPSCTLSSSISAAPMPNIKPALELPLVGQRIDDRADVGGEQHFVDAHRAGLAVDFRVDDVASELEIARLTGLVRAVVGAQHLDRRAARDALGDVLERRRSIAGVTKRSSSSRTSPAGQPMASAARSSRRALNSDGTGLRRAAEDVGDALAADARIGRRTAGVAVACTI